MGKDYESCLVLRSGRRLWLYPKAHGGRVDGRQWCGLQVVESGFALRTFTYSTLMMRLMNNALNRLYCNPRLLLPLTSAQSIMQGFMFQQKLQN